MKLQEIILEMEKLLPEERQEVIQHFDHDLEERYAPEVIAELLDRKKDAERGLNMSEGYRGDEITAPLKSLMEK